MAEAGTTARGQQFVHGVETPLAQHPRDDRGCIQDDAG
jgi:hypothetical protein